MLINLKRIMEDPKKNNPNWNSSDENYDMQNEIYTKGLNNRLDIEE